MVLKLGATTAKHLLSKSLFLIAIGTNDMAAFAAASANNGQMQSHGAVAAFYSDLISNFSATITVQNSNSRFLFPAKHMTLYLLKQYD